MPPVAMPGLPVVLTKYRLPSVTTVPAPLRTTTSGSESAASAAARSTRSAWTSAIVDSRSAGRTRRDGESGPPVGSSPASSSVCPTRALRPSASMTSGLSVAVIKNRSSRRMSSDWPSPGPTAMTSAGCDQPFEDRLRRFELDQSLIVAGQGIGHVGRLEAGDGRLDFGGAGDPDQPGSGSEGRGPAEGGGAGHASRARHDQNGAEAPLVAVARTWRQDRDRFDRFERHGRFAPRGCSAC